MRAGGGRAFLPTRSWGTFLAIGIVAGSIIYGLAKNAGYGEFLLLSPGLLLKGFVYQVLSYSFIDREPMGVLFGAMAMWQMGSSLEVSWGRKRFLWFSLAVPAIAGVLTALFVLLVPTPLVSWDGAWVMAGSCWLAYGWSFGKRQTGFWGMPVSGNTLAIIGLLFMLLTALLGHWSLVIPRAFAAALTFAYVRYGSPAGLLTQLRGWLLQRKLKSKNKHLRVVGKERNIGGGSDEYLH
jgi:membrane associated rhomboid family serine protease